ncbi:unnamed protein product, partial [Linum tenue]
HFSGPSSPREASGPNTRRARLICQFCEKPGHSVRQCFQLFPPNRSAHPTNRPAPAQAHFTNAAPSLLPAVGNPSSSTQWLMDSAASHHVTGDLGNLSLYSDYTGPDELIVGNGSGSTHGGADAERGKQR